MKNPKIHQKTPYAKTLSKIQGPYTRIYLIRHCHPDYTLKDKLGDKKMPLDKLGIKQRKLLNKSVPIRHRIPRKDSMDFMKQTFGIKFKSEED